MIVITMAITPSLNASSRLVDTNAQRTATRCRGSGQRAVGSRKGPDSQPAGIRQGRTLPPTAGSVPGETKSRPSTRRSHRRRRDAPPSDEEQLSDLVEIILTRGAKPHQHRVVAFWPVVGA